MTSKVLTPTSDKTGSIQGEDFKVVSASRYYLSVSFLITFGVAYLCYRERSVSQTALHLIVSETMNLYRIGRSAASAAIANIFIFELAVWIV